MSDPKESNEEFYVGYLPTAPTGLARFLRGRILVLLLVVLGMAALLSAVQSRFSKAVFEFGETRTFEGWIEETPFPTLAVPRPGGGTSRYLLTRFGKFGAEEDIAGLHGRAVQLEGTLIYRDDQTMIELSGPPTEVLGRSDSPPPSAPSGGETRILVGEIVDSKCYLGVMKPGNLKPHRACATRCISGGVPPVLLTRDAEGRATYYLLIGEDGSAVNATVVARQLVAEPVLIRGTVEKIGDRQVLLADPLKYERY